MNPRLPSPVRIEATRATTTRVAYGKRCPAHGVSLEGVCTGLYLCPRCGTWVDRYGTLVRYTPETRRKGEQIYGKGRG